MYRWKSTLVDTGTFRSTVSGHVYKARLASVPLLETKVHYVSLLGSVKVPVSYKGSQVQCLVDLLVVKGKNPSSFGRDLLERVKLDLGSIFSVERSDKRTSRSDLQISQQLKELLKTNEALFEASSLSLGMNGFTASLKLKANAKPVFQKDGPVTYSLVSQAKKEYERLRETGIINSIDTNNWASPVVHIEKLNGNFRVVWRLQGLNECIEDDNCNNLISRHFQPDWQKTELSLSPSQH
ncbi:hypothetical protein HOLleu_14641 [Holothuria leucospilota]|uniref:Uncharacterized protein n=1 Tax=Holothuria leucospilota TaxID=206669 RepID=A0A9Q1C8X2_HOLLE|nr:hypothetical protein HOLleu_14641 [Holothuria leucospilota]